MNSNRLLNLDKLKFEIRQAMRYDDVGDYYDDTIIAYDMKDQIVNNAILLHEFIEYTLIKSAGLTAEMIDSFDNDPTSHQKHPREFALYSKFHNMANRIERQFIENLGLDWEKHDEIIYTTKVVTAVKNVTNQLHLPYPSEEKIEKSKKIVHDTFKKEDNS